MTSIVKRRDAKSQNNRRAKRGSQQTSESFYGGLSNAGPRKIVPTSQSAAKPQTMMINLDININIGDEMRRSTMSREELSHLIYQNIMQQQAEQAELMRRRIAHISMQQSAVSQPPQPQAPLGSHAGSMGVSNQTLRGGKQFNWQSLLQQYSQQLLQ